MLIRRQTWLTLVLLILFRSILIIMEIFVAVDPQVIEERLSLLFVQ